MAFMGETPVETKFRLRTFGPDPVLARLPQLWCVSHVTSMHDASFVGLDQVIAHGSEIK
jgi:hypothetical protein